MRLFTCIELSDEIKMRLREVSEHFYIKGVVPAKEEAYHITLHFLGEVERERVAGIIAALSSIKSEPFFVEVRGVSFFGGERITTLFAEIGEGADKTERLYDKACSALSGIGIRYENRRYVPHVTLARVKYVKRSEELTDIIGRYSGYAFGKMRVDAFSLKRSTLTAHGPIYEELHKVRL